MNIYDVIVMTSIAVLTPIIIALDGLASLGVPVWAWVVYYFIFFPSWMIFTYTIFNSAFIGAILSAIAMFNLSNSHHKWFITIDTLFSNVSAGVFLGFVGAFLRTVSFRFMRPKFLTAIEAIAHFNKTGKVAFFRTKAKGPSFSRSKRCPAISTNCIVVFSGRLSSAVVGAMFYFCSKCLELLTTVKTNATQFFLGFVNTFLATILCGFCTMKRARKLTTTLLTNGSYNGHIRSLLRYLNFISGACDSGKHTCQWVIGPFKPIGIIL